MGRGLPQLAGRGRCYGVQVGRSSRDIRASGAAAINRAVPGARGVPVAALADRPAQHRPHPAGAHPLPAGERGSVRRDRPARHTLVREALTWAGERGLRQPVAPRPRTLVVTTAAGHGNRRVRPGIQHPHAAPRLPAPAPRDAWRVPRQPVEPAHVRRPPRAGSVHRRRGPAPAALSASAATCRRPALGSRVGENGRVKTSWLVLAARTVVVLVVDAAALFLLSPILPGFEVRDAGRRSPGGRRRPAQRPRLAALSRFALPLNVLTLGFAALVLNGVLVTGRRDPAGRGHRRLWSRGSWSRRADRAHRARSGAAGDRRRRRPGTATSSRARRAGAARGARATCPACCSWRSTAWPTTCCSARSATATRRRSARWLREATTGSSAGRPTGRRRPAPARRACCTAVERRHARVPLVGEGPRRRRS